MRRVSGNSDQEKQMNRRDYLAMKKNTIPFPLIASILKPARKLPQYYESFILKFFRKKREPEVTLTQVSLSPRRIAASAELTPDV